MEVQSQYRWTETKEWAGHNPTPPEVLGENPLLAPSVSGGSRHPSVWGCTSQISPPWARDLLMCRSKTSLFYMFLGSPGGPVVENPPANVGNTGLIPGPGRFHMQQGNDTHKPQLPKPSHLEPLLCNKRRHCSEKPSQWTKISFLSPQLETARGATMIHHSPKSINQYVNTLKKWSMWCNQNSQTLF